MVRTRWIADPACAFGAESGGELVGSAFVTRWGSSAVFGPLTVRPDYWNRGVARLLWAACDDLIDGWGVTHAGLFTRPEPKNIHLYQSLDFWPGSLTALTEKELGTAAPASAPDTPADVLDECRRVSDAVFPGLDLECEIVAVHDQALGATVRAPRRRRPAGFAVCHAGEGTEAGPGACYVKFAAARPGEEASARLAQLIDAVEGYAAASGATPWSRASTPPGTGVAAAARPRPPHARVRGRDAAAERAGLRPAGCLGASTTGADALPRGRRRRG